MQILTHLLRLLENYLTLFIDEWEMVLSEHNKLFQAQLRSVAGLRRKFSTLHRKKIPTGDPLIPADVKGAKHVRYRMTERADMGIADEDPED